MMELSRLIIYATAHGIDPVQDHVSRLENSEISPDIVALELPNVNSVEEDINSFSLKITKQSPATGLVWHIIERVKSQEYEDSDQTASRGDSEFEAGRQYADEHEIPHFNVDLDRYSIADRYASWPRRIRDSVTLLLGASITLAMLILALFFGIGSLGILLEQGLTRRGIWQALFGVAATGIFLLISRSAVKSTLRKIGRWFRDTIREIRDKEMYSRIRRIAREESAEEVLLIAGAAHFSGIKALADKDELTCRQIESPSVSAYEGDLEELTLNELEELLESAS